MTKEERYTIIYDAGDWILDTKTDEYIELEEACNKLNDYDEHMRMVAECYQDFCRMLDEAEKE